MLPIPTRLFVGSNTKLDAPPNLPSDFLYCTESTPSFAFWKSSVHDTQVQKVISKSTLIRDQQKKRIYHKLSNKTFFKKISKNIKNDI